MRIRLLFLILVLFLRVQSRSAFSAAETVPLEYSPRIERYALQEITFQLRQEFRNPYDPDEVAVEGVFLTPLDRELKLPAFFYKAYDPMLNQPREGAGWKLRFTPREVGGYSFKIFLSHGRAGRELVGEGAFECVPSRRPGFVTREGRRFVLTTGQHFFPLGANRCWGDLRWPEGYLYDMEELAANGANCLRVWLAPWWMSVESEQGRYDPAACARLDAVFQKAEALGLRLILCIEQHGNLQPEWAEIGLWRGHPYNTANGGPCPTRISFFSNPEASRLFKNRLRYLIARWGYSTSLMAWELFNEVEWVVFEEGGLAENFRKVADWHREMSRFLRRGDCFGHLVTTSSDIPLQRKLLTEGALDFMHLHLYEDADLLGRIETFVLWLSQDLSVPVLVGEFGPRMKRGDTQWVARGIFTTAFAGAGSGALPWLQDVKSPLEYYQTMAAAEKFFRDIRWASEGFELVEPESVESVTRNVESRRMVMQPHRRLKVFVLRGNQETLVFASEDGAFRSRGYGRPSHRAMRLKLAMPVRGAYAVEAWNPEDGTIIRRDVFETDEAELTVLTPEFAHDIALKISWLRPPGK